MLVQQIIKECKSGFGVGKWAEADLILSRIIENIYTVLNRLLIEIWMLITLLVRIQKEVRTLVEKVYITLENT